MGMDEKAARLRGRKKADFERVFRVTASDGKLVPPQTMYEWIVDTFGGVKRVREQKIVKVTNLVTLEEVLFNGLRSSRPIARSTVELDDELKKSEPLDRPYRDTPEDTFGRVEGDWCVTASNIAKFDGFHGLVIFGEKHPLHFTREQVHDYLKTGEEWARQGEECARQAHKKRTRRARKVERSAVYYLFIWNCLWRAGASLLHGHAQVLLGRDMHYAAVERLRRAAESFRRDHKQNYFDALYTAHELVGAGFERGAVRVMASLTPIKENEVILLAKEMSDALKDRIYDVLACFRDRLGVSAFNLVLYRPPLAPTPESWKGFPFMVRIVDRGDPGARTSDIAGMELYAASVVASDPLKLAQTLQDALPA